MTFRDVGLDDAQKKRFAQEYVQAVKTAKKAGDVKAQRGAIAAKAKVHVATLRYWAVKKFKLI